MTEMEKIDKTLANLVDLAYTESEKAKSKSFFSKDLAEACGVIISLVYNRYQKDDK